VEADEFFQGAFQTARTKQELLTELRIPIPPKGTRWGYHKLKFCTSSWPIVTASCLITPGAEGGPTRVRVALGGASPAPVVIELEWASEDISKFEAVANAAAAAIEEWTDELAGPGYRRAVAAVVAGRAIRAAVARSVG